MCGSVDPAVFAGGVCSGVGPVFEGVCRGVGDLLCLQEVCVWGSVGPAVFAGGGVGVWDLCLKVCVEV